MYSSDTVRYRHSHVIQLHQWFRTKSVRYTSYNVKHRYLHIQGVSRLVDITAGGDLLGLCDQKSSYKHVSDFGR